MNHWLRRKFSTNLAPTETSPRTDGYRFCLHRYLEPVHRTFPWDTFLLLVYASKHIHALLPRGWPPTRNTMVYYLVINLNSVMNGAYSEKPSLNAVTAVCVAFQTTSKLWIEEVGNNCAATDIPFRTLSAREQRDWWSRSAVLSNFWCKSCTSHWTGPPFLVYTEIALL
jgi:hypothetical protein